MSDAENTAESVKITHEDNGEQRLLVFDGDRASGVVAIDQDVDADAALELVDAVEAEVATNVPSLRRLATSEGNA